MAQPTGPRTLAALAAANARYWPTVAPTVQRELRRWTTPAATIPDPQLRTLALEKLQYEAFNAEVAATLATLAPRPQRTAVTQAIVALELLFDYLDGRTEDTSLPEARRLFGPFLHAVDTDDKRTAISRAEEQPADLRYLTDLSDRTRSILRCLPGARVVAASVAASAARCAEGQARLHVSANTGDGQLEQWARASCSDSGLEWREYLAGCASSVLAAHALIAAAADPITSEQDARAIDAAYLAIAAVITILDSVVDEPQDRAHGRPGLLSLYEHGELTARIRTLTREALGRTSEAPHAAHHAMTLAGVAAYYTTHPGAREGAARPIVHAVRGELTPTIWPALAVLHGWRLAKRAYSITRDRRASQGINSSRGEKP